MRSMIIAFLVMSVLIFGSICVSAQSIKTFIERLDAVESQLEKLNNDQQILGSEYTKITAENENKYAAINKKLSEIDTNGTTVDTGNVDELAKQVNVLRDQIKLVMNDVAGFSKKDDSPSEDIVNNIRASIKDLRQEIKLALLHDNNAVVPGVSSGETVISVETPFSVEHSVDVGVFSKYVWRGILLTDDPAAQPSFTVSTANGISLNVWASMDITDVNNNGKEVNELDFTLDYSFDIKSLSLSTGLIQYTFPNTTFGSTTELYLGLSSELTGNASLTFYQDIGSVDGTYISLGHGGSIPVGNLTSIDISGALGWGSSKNNAYYYGEDSGAVTDFIIGMSVPLEVGGLISVTPSVAFTSIVNGKVRNAVSGAGSEKDNLVFGVTLSGGF